jgi:hypothetical protein
MARSGIMPTKRGGIAAILILCSLGRAELPVPRSAPHGCVKRSVRITSEMCFAKR